MKYPALALLILPVSTPALAHMETVPHVHTESTGLWLLALVMAAAIGVKALVKRI